MPSTSPQNTSYTKIENDILDFCAKANLSGSAYAVLFYLLRKLNGYHKEQDAISNSQIAKGINRSIRSVITGTNELQLVKIISLVKKGSSVNSPNVWRIEKNPNVWELVQKPALVKKSTLVKKTATTSEENGKKLVKISSTTKESITKEIYTKEMFNEFWNLYPRKQSKVDAEKKYKILVKDGYHEEIIKGLQRYLRYWKQHKTEPRYIPLPTSWLNAQRWNDDLDLKPVYQERKLDLPPGWVPPPPPKRASSDLLKLSRKRFEELKRTGLFLNTT